MCEEGERAAGETEVNSESRHVNKIKGEEWNMMVRGRALDGN